MQCSPSCWSPKTPLFCIGFSTSPQMPAEYVSENGLQHSLWQGTCSTDAVACCLDIDFFFFSVACKTNFCGMINYNIGCSNRCARNTLLLRTERTRMFCQSGWCHVSLIQRCTPMLLKKCGSTLPSGCSAMKCCAALIYITRRSSRTVAATVLL